MARHWWITPVILDTQEAEIRRIHSLKPAQANSSQDLISKTSNTQKGWWSGTSPEFISQYKETNNNNNNKKKKTLELSYFLAGQDFLKL
jgi:hypothetical protein